MENVYDFHQHAYCFVMHIGKEETTTYIHTNSKRIPDIRSYNVVDLEASISYNKQRTDVTCFGGDSGEKERGDDDIVIDNFLDGLYNLFKKDKETWNEEDKFLVRAVSDYLPLAVKETIKKLLLKIENLDLLHYAFVVPSEWEEEMRDDIIRPIFVQSDLISKEDHQNRLLFFTDVEATLYNYSLERGQNTILCRVIAEKEETIVKFNLIQTTTTLHDIPNAKLFPKVMKSNSVYIPKRDIEGRIEDFLREKLFPAAMEDNDGVRKSLESTLVPSDQEQIIEAIIKGINSRGFRSLKEEKEDDEEEDDNEDYDDEAEEPWITFKEDWMLNESQKEFINSLRPSIICAEIGSFLLDYLKDTVSNNFAKIYMILFVMIYRYVGRMDTQVNEIMWLKDLLMYNIRSLNHFIGPEEDLSHYNLIMYGASIGVFEAIQNSDMYCKPHIVSSGDLSISSSVFSNSKPDAIINLDISLESTSLNCSILDEDGFIQQIFSHDNIIGDKHLPPLRHFYTFSNTTTLNVKKQFIPFAERYLLGDLSDLIADDGASIKKVLLLEMKALLTNDVYDEEVLVSINKQEYIKAFILMYIIYIKEAILYKLSVQLVSYQMDMKIGYAVSIEAMLLNKTLENKDNLRDIIYSSGLVPKDDNSKKLRITTQGERILPAIQKSLKLELSLKSYFLLCQLHEDYVQLTLHQVVTASSPEEKEQESIIVQDEIIPIQNIYDSLCSSMWYNLQQESSLLDLCKIHSTSDNSKTLNLFSPEIKTEFFAKLKRHISDNVLQDNPDTQSTNAVNLTGSCSCKVRLTTFDIIDVSFLPVLQDLACTLSASLLNKGLFGNYLNIDYLFSFIRFNNNPQLQYALTRILEDEANNFNIEMGVDTSCLVVPELFSQLLQPVIAHQPLGYKEFKMGVLQQVCSENYVFSLNEGPCRDEFILYKSKISDTKTIECENDITFPFINKGDVIINNIQPNKRFYLWRRNDFMFYKFEIDLHIFETMNYLKNTGILSQDDNIHKYVGDSTIYFGDYFALRGVGIPVMVSIRYVSYISAFQFFVKIVGSGTEDESLTGMIEIGEPLTLARL